MLINTIKQIPRDAKIKKQNHIRNGVQDLEGKCWEGEGHTCPIRKRKADVLTFQFSHVSCLDETIKDGKPHADLPSQQ